MSVPPAAPRILITGNQGYLGPALVRHLREVFPAATLIGFDTGYFAAMLTTSSGLSPEHPLDSQIIGDIRSLDRAQLAGVDVVVHLAAISNDPMGTFFEAVTHEINALASLALAEAARAAGVGHFVFASSCSVYGYAPGVARKETDTLDPQTAYARSKVWTERALASLPPGDMVVTSLRFATACGMSDRLRLDLALNDFVASAVATRSITVLSDGTPWRPLIDIRDMARAIAWACVRPPAQGGPVLSVNVGAAEGNYQVRALAEAVARAVPGTTVRINPTALPENRSYKVDFSTFAALAPDHQPRVGLGQSIRMLIEGLTALGFANPVFRESALIRLHALERHRDAGYLDEALRWTARAFAED